ncbi:MAG: dTDP-4-dehydrorhamnose reductase [Candidatus Dormibacteria bacterium]|jgi:dTDP-4-dehydrorhamnose reductase|nr:dTDP-4-dehydrorhamnose reductase [Chloroflexota bacterium]HBV93857.1 dTDP-4-dehydrorhamnose reductase [Chloroflexota bacterium]
MRIEIIGSRGQLGRELLWTLAGTSHRATGHDVEAVDIRDPGSVGALLDQVRPDAVINCAAWTRVDAAETEEAAAYAVNAEGPRVLAEACRPRGVLLCHLSTDYVFDGTATEPIDEAATPHPQSAYGRGKLAGEEAVRAALTSHQIARTAWLYGQEGPNFVLTMLRLARERAALRVVADQWGSPTWTGHLAPALVRLVERGEPGTYHLTNSGTTSWHGFAEAIVAEAGLSVPVEAIQTADYPTPAPRPAYSVLANRAWQALGEAPLPAWREGLRAYLAELAGRPPQPAAT